MIPEKDKERLSHVTYLLLTAQCGSGPQGGHGERMTTRGLQNGNSVSTILLFFKNYPPFLGKPSTVEGPILKYYKVKKLRPKRDLASILQMSA